MEVLLFWVFAILSVGCGVMVVLHRNPMDSAIYLVVTMLCLAGLYALLTAAFIAVIQVLVYAGAVMVLMLFVIMMLNLHEDTLQREGQTIVWVLAGIIGVLVVLRLARLFPARQLPCRQRQTLAPLKQWGTNCFHTISCHLN